MMEEIIREILANGVKEVITTEPVLGGLTRPLSIRYTSAAGIVVENITYPENTAMERWWGAIESIAYVLTTATEAEIHEVQKQRKRGDNIVDDLLVALKAQNMTDVQKSNLFDIILPVVVLCLSGDLRAAKAKAELIPVNSPYTQGRKDYLVARIQDEINNL